MPFVPVPNVVMAEMRMLHDLQQVENTLYFNMGTTPDPADMTGLANALIAWWGAFYAPNVGAAVELREVVVTDLSSATGPQVAVSPLDPLTGELAQETLPSNVSLTVSFRTANRGRSFRGRNYVVGITENQVSINTVAGNVVSAWIDSYDELRTGAIADLGDWVVVSRYSGVNPSTGAPIPRTTGIATPVQSVTVVDNVVDSQRRRLPGRGK